MRSGAWLQDSVRTVSSETPGLLERPKSAQVTRELGTALPGQFSVGGFKTATGSVSQAGELVAQRVGTPYSRRDWPQSGDPVAVDATDGVNRHRIFTGSVDGTGSSFASPDADVNLVDSTDRLSAQVSHNALFRTMPPMSTKGDERPRMTGLTTPWVTDLCARAAGFYATPPRQGYGLIHAPLMGSTWPERGELIVSGRDTDIDQWHRYQPNFSNEQGTVWADYLYATYRPDTYGSLHTGAINTSRPLSITFGAAKNLSTSGYVSCVWDTGLEWRVSVTSSRDVAVVWRQRATGTQTTIAVMNAEDAPGWGYVSVKLDKRTNETLHVQIRTDTGYARDLVTNVVDSVVYSRQFERAVVYAPPGARLNGVQVSAHTGDGVVPGFKPTFRLEADYVSALDVAPALVSTPAVDLLSAQAEAECAALWFDEDGALRWHGRRKLTEQPIRATLTSSQIADARITLDAQDTRSRIAVKHLTWATSVTTRSRIIVYEGQKDELGVGDTVESIITPPADEQWVQVDSNPATIYGGMGVARFNNGEGSFHGYTVLTKNGDEFSESNWDRRTISFKPIGPAAWKSSLTLEELPGSADRVTTSTRNEDSTDLKPSYRGRGLPLLRAMGKATSTEAEFVSAIRGPSWAPELVHDVGWFIQHDTRIQGVADFIAAELAQSRPRLSGIEVLPDPRIQLGDKVRLVESARTGLEVVGVVVSVSQSIGAGEHTMTLELMVLSVVAAQVTLGEFDDWYDGLTLGQVDAVFSEETLGQRDARPLRS